MTSAPGVTGVPTVIGVDAGSADLRDADHRVRVLAAGLGLPPDAVACTHLVRDPVTGPRTALSLALPDADSAAAAWQRLAALTAGPEELAAAWGDRVLGPGPAAGRAASRAAAEHARKEGGRAVLYPGADRLTGTVTVAGLLAGSAIEDTLVVGAPPGHRPDPGARVLTRDHVRPEWRQGRLTLALVPAAGGLLAPFEVPDPTPCCVDHP